MHATRSTQSQRTMSQTVAEEGFTLVELLIGIALVSIVLTAASALIFSFIRLSNTDIGRVKTNQNLRTALDIIDADVRQSGESIANVYAISGFDFSSTNRFITVRSAFDETAKVNNVDTPLQPLPVCQSLAGSFSNVAVVKPTTSVSGSQAVCAFSSSAASDTVATILKPWQAFLSGHPSLPALVYNPVTKQITRVTISAINIAGNPLNANSTVTVNNLSSSSNIFNYGSVILPINERTYAVNSANILTLSINGSVPVNVAYGITNLTAVATTLNPLTNITDTYTEFNIYNLFSQLQGVVISLTGGNDGVGKANPKTLTRTIFTRNSVQSIN